MSMCLALTKAGKPCKNNGEVIHRSESEVVYSHTCVCHRNYFTEHLDTWKEQIKRKSYSSHVYYQIEQLLKNKLITITPDDPIVQANNFWSICLVPLFALYVDGYSIDWNPSSFGMAVRQVGNVWKYRIYLKGLLALARCSSHCYVLSIIMKHYLLHASEFNAYQVYAKTNLDEWLMYALKKDESLCFVKDEYMALYSILYEYDHVYAAKFLSYVKKQQRIFLEEKKGLLAPIKEELMATTWHPTRMQPWCLDEEEKEFLRENTV